MHKQHSWHPLRAFVLAWLSAFSSGSLSGQHLLLSVRAQADAQCSPAVTNALDPQGTEARLRAVGFQIARARNATLAHEVNCTVDRRTVAVHQCLSLSEFVAVPFQSRAVQLAKPWRECKTYSCVGAACGDAVSAGLRDLEARFLANVHPQANVIADLRPNTPPYTPAPPAVKRSAGAFVAGIPGASLYYLCYILTCMTVFFRWQVCKHAR
jgi:hypothetical protein